MYWRANKNLPIVAIATTPLHSPGNLVIHTHLSAEPLLSTACYLPELYNPDKAPIRPENVTSPFQSPCQCPRGPRFRCFVARLCQTRCSSARKSGCTAVTRTSCQWVTFRKQWFRKMLVHHSGPVRMSPTKYLMGRYFSGGSYKYSRGAKKGRLCKKFTCAKPWGKKESYRYSH